MAKLVRHLGENVPPELVTAQVPHAQLPSKEGVSNGKRRSMSVRVTSPRNIPFAPRPEVLPETQANSDWVGEWNRSDIRDVQRELRNLKAVRW